MKVVVFDSSSLISLAMNNLLWTLRKLKQGWNGEFAMPNAVKEEVVDKPLRTKKYKLEAINIEDAIAHHDLSVYNGVDSAAMLELLNTMYSAKNQNIIIVQAAEVEALILAVQKKADAYVVDERTMRLAVEDPMRLHQILEGKLHTKIQVNKEKMRVVQEFVKELKIIRSTELMMVALEKGILEEYTHVSPKKDVAEAVLWGLRLRGCSIATEEIEELIQEEK